MSKRLRRLTIVGVAVCAAAVGSSIALATGGGGNSTAASLNTQDPVANISALGSAPASLDRAAAGVVSRQNAITAATGIVGLGLPGQARTLPGTVDGKPVYVLPTDKGLFCAVTNDDSEVCSPAFTAQRPAFIGRMDDDGPGGAPPTFWGIAMDGVTQITATISGASVSIPVKHNLFEYHGSSATTVNDLSASSATFADGTSVQLP
jgi:hypothetical protein